MFRFTIRELLTLTLAAGLAVGWWLDHRKIQNLNAQLSEQVIETGQWRTCAGGLEDILKSDGWYVWRGKGRLKATKETDLGFTIINASDSKIEPKLDSHRARPASESYYANWPRTPD